MPKIMVVGTASNAGKSLLVTALCRLLAQRGAKVTPFKGQNMALNSYAVAGGEIGYAQAVQAWAAKIEPQIAHNPILLKPQGDMTSQVILNGQVAGVTQAADYYRDYFAPGWRAITQALAELDQTYDWIVCEGAGSPAEINLKHRDLTNMRVAAHLGARTILVVNIDLGGAFAHVVGTLALLTPSERALIQGIVINKFRGQRSLLQSGIEWLEQYTGIPVLGVLPYLDLQLPAEDSLALLERRSRSQPAATRIGVIRLPRMANFTDFDPLLAEPSINLEFIQSDRPLPVLDAVIIPGSKTTIADLIVLQTSGMAVALQNFSRQGGTILGICGGWQMLGQRISDPAGLEGKAGTYAGLGLLPMHTHITGTKTVSQIQAIATYPPQLAGTPINGYEIHQGKSELINPTGDFLFSDRDLGYAEGNIWGTYLHGIFDQSAWRRTWINTIRQGQGLPPLPLDLPDYSQQRDLLFDQLAIALEQHLDLSRLIS
ncbi:MAG: cobyric acid synthase [Pseudanabaenaceae cyanobacterium bins.68]|nr:cobyric acid synthase [Pseudanabaenaceae cyanobacterium bins.68]